MVSVLDMVADRGISFMGKAHEVISGGQFVKAMSVATPGSSGKPEDYIGLGICDAAGDNASCVGIALHGAASGNGVTVATQGIYRTNAAAALTVGAEVATSADAAAVTDATFTCAGSAEALDYLKPIGTALTSAGSGEKVFIKLNV